jgi:hypothetical protein
MRIFLRLKPITCYLVAHEPPSVRDIEVEVSVEEVNDYFRGKVNLFDSGLGVEWTTWTGCAGT